MIFLSTWIKPIPMESDMNGMTTAGLSHVSQLLVLGGILSLNIRHANTSVLSCICQIAKQKEANLPSSNRGKLDHRDKSIPPACALPLDTEAEFHVVKYDETIITVETQKL